MVSGTGLHEGIPALEDGTLHPNERAPAQ